VTAARARSAAETVVDPELPMLTLADLGVLRDVQVIDGAVEVAITPTYIGCPAMTAMCDDLARALRAAGFADVRVRVDLSVPWTTDWISERGRAALHAAGISPPEAAPRHRGPVPLTLTPTRRPVTCPRCGGERTQVVSEFGATACKASYRCSNCLEPFEHLKGI